MGLKYLVKLLRRFRVVILVTLTFVVSVRAYCDSYRLRNDDDHDVGDWRNDDDGEDWQLYTFTERGGCLVCFFGVSGQRGAELVLPCWDQYQQRISRSMVSYMFCRPGDDYSGMPLSYKRSDTICEKTANYNPFHIEEFAESVDFDQCKRGNITINVDPNGYSYHLEASQINPNSFICLTDVEYIPFLTIAEPSPSPTYASTRITTVPAPTLTGTTSSSSTASTRVTTATTFAVLTSSPTTASTRVTTVSVTEYTATTTSNHSSSNGNQKTALEQRQSKFPIWVIFVIIAIVISICAIAVVVFRRRKQHDHQQANNVNTGRVNDKSNLRMDNMKNDKDVIANPTYGQEPVIGKEEEYHSYTEIDVKIPDNSEMIYNSAYESTPASSDMVYNSAYESPTVTSDMVYNSAYESSPSN